MFTTIENKSWFREFGNDIRFHWRIDPEQFRTALDQRIAGVRVIAGCPAGLPQARTVYARPGEHCLYDSLGHRIIESCTRRGPGLSEFVAAGVEAIEPPESCPVIREPLVYLSAISGHWGHFLTEGISRLWARIECPEMSSLRCLSHLPYPDTASVREYLIALGIGGGQLLHFDEPVRIDQCIVPGASFSNRAEAYSIHLRASQIVVAESDGAGQAAPSAQAVYLSRSQLSSGSGRRIRGEPDLERSLAALGVRIVYPERLDLAQQIALFNAHRVFIGCLGSAFHGLCLSAAPRKITTHVLCEVMPNANYLMFDAMLGCASNYVQTLFPTPGKTQIFPDLDLTLDVPACLRYLQRAGCV
jgi:capsular polysaccharide biosynthesis protein